MKVELLEQYVSLKKEIKSLEKEIERRQMQGARLKSDVVKASRKCIPFDQHFVSIGGRDYPGFERDISRLNARKARLQSLVSQIDAFVDEISDSRIRQIIEYRYIRGLPWLVVSRKVYGYPCEDRARKKIQRFLEKF